MLQQQSVWFVQIIIMDRNMPNIAYLITTRCILVILNEVEG